MGISGNRERRGWWGMWCWGGGEVCRYEGCGKVCRNKAGLVMHEKRMHRVNEERGRLKRERCGRGFDAKGQRVSHVRSCTGGAYGEEGDRRQCGWCRRWVSRANYARHVRACGRVEVGGLFGGRMLGLGLGGREVRMVTCGGCGKEMRAGNLARHQRGACRVWAPGRGQTPDGGRRPEWMDGWNKQIFHILCFNVHYSLSVVYCHLFGLEKLCEETSPK